MANFFLAPFLALFSVAFYKQRLVTPLRTGFLYLLYLSFLLSIFATARIRIQLLPVANEFVDWLRQSLPEITVTAQGIQTKTQEPILLTHPQWGPLIYLDPTKDAPQSGDFEKALVTLTRRKVAYRSPEGGEVRIQDLLPQGPQRGQQDFLVTGEGIAKLWRGLAPWLTAIFFVSSLAAIYLWKLAASLGYSLVALILNLFRREKLSYKALIHFSIYTLTPVAFLQIIASLFPAWPIPLNFITALLVTGIYLSLAIFATQSPRPTQ